MQDFVFYFLETDEADILCQCYTVVLIKRAFFRTAEHSSTRNRVHV
jgi:hypothetical protein